MPAHAEPNPGLVVVLYVRSYILATIIFFHTDQGETAALCGTLVTAEFGHKKVSKIRYPKILSFCLVKIIFPTSFSAYK